MALPETPHSSCPGEESLLNFLLAADETLAVHLRTCSACSAEADRVRHRLALSDEIAMAVPAHLAARIAPAAAPTPLPSPWRRAVAAARDWLDGLRLPTLVPVGAMAAVLLVMALGTPSSDVAPQAELTREIELRQPARLTRQAVLRTEPASSARALRHLVDGESVVLSDRQEDWYQVALADGTTGWIEVAAFE